MKKKFFAVLIVFILITASLFAEDSWWVGQKIGSFQFNGLSAVSSADVNNVLYPYKGQDATVSLVNEMSNKLLGVKGISTVESAATTSEDSGNLILVFSFTEFPKIGSINYLGDSKVKEASIKDVVKDLKVGDFFDSKNTVLLDSAVVAIKDLYRTKGFGEIPVNYEITDSREGYVDIYFKVTEGIQTRVTAIDFEGNEKVNDSSLKKLISSSKKAIFSSGYYNEKTVVEDVSAISEHYLSQGYLDVKVAYEVTDDVSTNENYHDVKLKFVISEGSVWTYGGMDVSGNKIFSSQEIEGKFTSEVGKPVNYSKIESDFLAVQDIYYNNGYITTPINVREERDEERLKVQYHVEITEGAQSIIEKIVIEGLEKTKDHVMLRELTLKEGDVFSKEALITSMQNLYNTGLLSDVGYDIQFGQTPDGVILKFICTEGSHMSIQFGATFGGNVTGFPISGFLQWSDSNLGGNGQQINVSTTLSPDTQSADVSFGSQWFKNTRWANSIDVSFEHSKYEGEMQKGIASLSYDDLDYDYKALPLGYEEMIRYGLNTPADEYLMNYHLYSVNLGYSTGYTWIYNSGRLSVSGGLDLGMNHAVYDKTKYEPYDKIIYKYGQKWQFSNKLSVGLTWDGRDYIQSPTKGYVLSTSFTYAGGILGGLSNYNKVSGSASGYLKLFEIKKNSEKTKNVMFCATTSVSSMLPQFYKHSDLKKWDWYDAKLGTSRYEMLYIDGMTMARGHESVTGLKLVWDNMLEISYPLAENVVQAEAFVSATGAMDGTVRNSSKFDWYYAVGAGVKMKIPGFPLGLYLVKDAMTVDGTFKLDGGSLFKNSNNPTSGLKLVLAISTSLI